MEFATGKRGEDYFNHRRMINRPPDELTTNVKRLIELSSSDTSPYNTTLTDHLLFCCVLRILHFWYSEDSISDVTSMTDDEICTNISSCISILDDYSVCLKYLSDEFTTTGIVKKVKFSWVVLVFSIVCKVYSSEHDFSSIVDDDYIESKVIPADKALKDPSILASSLPTIPFNTTIFTFDRTSKNALWGSPIQNTTIIMSFIRRAFLSDELTWQLLLENGNNVFLTMRETQNGRLMDIKIYKHDDYKSEPAMPTETADSAGKDDVPASTYSMVVTYSDNSLASDYLTLATVANDSDHDPDPAPDLSDPNNTTDTLAEPEDPDLSTSLVDDTSHIPSGVNPYLSGHLSSGFIPNPDDPVDKQIGDSITAHGTAAMNWSLQHYNVDPDTGMPEGSDSDLHSLTFDSGILPRIYDSTRFDNLGSLTTARRLVSLPTPEDEVVSVQSDITTALIPTKVPVIPRISEVVVLPDTVPEPSTYAAQHRKKLSDLYESMVGKTFSYSSAHSSDKSFRLRSAGIIRSSLQSNGMAPSDVDPIIAGVMEGDFSKVPRSLRQERGSLSVVKKINQPYGYVTDPLWIAKHANNRSRYVLLKGLSVKKLGVNRYNISAEFLVKQANMSLINVESEHFPITFVCGANLDNNERVPSVAVVSPPGKASLTLNHYFSRFKNFFQNASALFYDTNSIVSSFLRGNVTWSSLTPITDAVDGNGYTIKVDDAMVDTYEYRCLDSCLVHSSHLNRSMTCWTGRQMLSKVLCSLLGVNNRVDEIKVTAPVQFFVSDVLPFSDENYLSEPIEQDCCVSLVDFNSGLRKLYCTPKTHYVLWHFVKRLSLRYVTLSKTIQHDVIMFEPDLERKIEKVGVDLTERSLKISDISDRDASVFAFNLALTASEFPFETAKHMNIKRNINADKEVYLIACDVSS